MLFIRAAGSDIQGTAITAGPVMRSHIQIGDFHWLNERRE
jgi:hypothetical protein